MSRRSIAVNRDIVKGKIKKSDFIMLRPAVGFIPDEEKLLGRKINRY